ncbi:SDR family oxidoreductase [Pseudoteredinibacter isoporae]|uniref:2-keto-3-deoxy-L-fuconate dehydrogenase n=1 Tax=Pseudoteredinibacter isoporae TaxID=570281 RepID=A0A7X0JUU1_9GAMM|nr:SDR family oxidoreductase [Pseudoteredinibacter isoporae]MBB6522688.1 2-keto-3-deoxy-L-fuconate dehydrogenase [Pseudoteredinibacter isoporae]NHO88219.1 SDR family oxidoreductase [Pseudoteredinibacter isoporae]NIB23450.1 SDR family oxidoreductase [Pseudoteredinibacter isoporae]
MKQNEFTNKRVVVTDCDNYMGPIAVEHFRAEGADVLAWSEALDSPQAIAKLLAEAGDTDILIANFGANPRPNKVENIADEEWFGLCDDILHPFIRVVRAFAGQMKAKGQGKIVAITSAAPLRAIYGASAYSAVRGAQNAFVRSAGSELARAGVQFNAIAQNYVENEDYYPREKREDPRFQEELKQVATRRCAEAQETANLMAFLASEQNTHIVGQAVPFAGGWATNS